MAVLSRGAVPAPVLRKKTVTVEALGGDVVLSGLMLGQMLALGRKGQGDQDFGHVCATLAIGVLLDDGKPMWTKEEWEVFGGTHPTVALDLFNQIDALCGTAAPESPEAKND